jgi:hypothetical protein
LLRDGAERLRNRLAFTERGADGSDRHAQRRGGDGPSACISTGKKNGAMASRTATIMEPLIMFPNSRMASATFREVSLIR